MLENSYIKVYIKDGLLSVKNNYHPNSDLVGQQPRVDLSNFGLCKYNVFHSNQTSYSGFDIASPIRIDVQDVEYWIISYDLLKRIKNSGSVEKFIHGLLLRNEGSLRLVLPKNINFEEFKNIMIRLVRHLSIESIIDGKD